MAYATLNGATIVKGDIDVPGWGLWHADLYLDRPMVVTSPATLVVADLTATCTVVRSVDWTGQRGVRVVGGYGGWRQVVAAKQFNAPSGLLLSTVLQTTAAPVGERLAIQTDATIGTAFLRSEGEASLVLHELVPAGWWVGFDGVTNVGERPTGNVLQTFTATRVDQPRNIVIVATENPAEWLPGKAYQSGQVQGTIQRVRHRIDGMKLRTEVVNA